MSRRLQRYASDASTDGSPNLHVWNWLWTNDFARSNDGADSIVRVGVQFYKYIYMYKKKHNFSCPDKQRRFVRFGVPRKFVFFSFVRTSYADCYYCRTRKRFRIFYLSKTQYALIAVRHGQQLDLQFTGEPTLRVRSRPGGRIHDTDCWRLLAGNNCCCSVIIWCFAIFRTKRCHRFTFFSNFFF